MICIFIDLSIDTQLGHNYGHKAIWQNGHFQEMAIMAIMARPLMTMKMAKLGVVFGLHTFYITATQRWLQSVSVVKTARRECTGRTQATYWEEIFGQNLCRRKNWHSVVNTWCCSRAKLLCRWTYLRAEKAPLRMWYQKYGSRQKLTIWPILMCNVGQISKIRERFLIWWNYII